MAWLKTFVTLGLIITGSTYASPITSLETIQPLDTNQSGALKPVKAETLQPLLRPDAKRIRLFWGPFNIYGAEERKTATSVDNNRLTSEGMIFDRRLTGVCKNCTVLAGKADLHFLNGTRATISHGVYNHHLLILDGAKNTLPWYLCPGQHDLGASKAAGFLITGVAEATNYYNPPNSSIKAGYHVGEKQDSFRLNAELINYREHSVEVYVTAEMEYLDGLLDDYMDASMSLLSVTG
jgi:hypothetical protein